jgi:hypothetical protein
MSLDEYISERVQAIRSLSIRFLISLVIYLSLKIFLPEQGKSIFIALGLITQIIAGLCLAIIGWLLLYKGSELLSLMKEGEEQFKFQVKVALITPLVLSLYFIKDVKEFYFVELFASYGWLSIVPFVILYWFGSHFIDHGDAIFVNTCLGFSIVLFLICLKSHSGYYEDYSDYDEISYTSFDKEAAKQFSQTGQYMMWYLGIVASSYLGIFSVVWKAELAHRAAKQTKGQS